MAAKGFTASATGPVAGPVDAGAGKTFRMFNLKVLSPAADAVVALETSPDGTTWTEQCRASGAGWAYAASNHARREARVNVIGLGTGAPALSAVISYY